MHTTKHPRPQRLTPNQTHQTAHHLIEGIVRGGLRDCGGAACCVDASAQAAADDIHARPKCYDQPAKRRLPARFGARSPLVQTTTQPTDESPDVTIDEELEREIGLCARCRYGECIPHPRGGDDYWRCGLSEVDARFAKYPKLPVRTCSGYTPKKPCGETER